MWAGSKKLPVYLKLVFFWDDGMFLSCLLFNNTQTLNFKTQPMIAFLTAVNHKHFDEQC